MQENFFNLSANGQTILKANYGVLNSPKNLNEMSREDAQDSDFRSFFGRIEEALNCFQDLLTFTGPMICTDLGLVILAFKGAWQNYFYTS